MALVIRAALRRQVAQMQPAFDLYVRRETWLQALDPRVKLLFVVVATALLFIVPGIGMAVAMALACTGLLWAARVPWRQIGRVWSAMGVLAAMVLVLTAIFGGGGGAVLLRIGPITVTAGSLAQGLLLAARLVALALIFAFWLFTTDQSAMVRGMVALRMPYEWGLTLALALRYLPIFASLYGQVRDAQQARGLDLAAGGLWGRLRALQPVLIAMIITALRNSEHLGRALEARALGARGLHRTVYRPLHMARADWLACAFLVTVLLAAVLLRVL
jgi:energy-coupling factor transport system permease protein